MDTGSNSFEKFEKQLNLNGNGILNVRFGIAGGGIHNEKTDDFDLQILRIGADDTLSILLLT